MKKALALILALALALSLLTACGGGSDTSEDPAQGAESSEIQGGEGSEVQGGESSENQGGAEQSGESSENQGEAEQGSESSENQGEAEQGGESSEAQGEESSNALTPEQVVALYGKTLPGGSTLETTGCAVMVGYLYENPDGTQESMDALAAELTAWAEENGNVPVVTSGVGEHVYFLMPADLDSYTVLVTGETDSLKPSVLSEGSRRFALRNILLPPMNGASEWQVIAVEEQDYYEEDGVQYPCYFMWLAE